MCLASNPPQAAFLKEIPQFPICWSSLSVAVDMAAWMMQEGNSSLTLSRFSGGLQTQIRQTPNTKVEPATPYCINLGLIRQR